MAICRPEAIDDAPARRAGAERRMAAVRRLLVAREEWANRSPRAWSAGCKPRGRKSHRRRCDQAIEAQPSFGQIKPSERPRGSRAEQHPGRRRGGHQTAAHKRPGSSSEGKETLACRKAVTPYPEQDVASVVSEFGCPPAPDPPGTDWLGRGRDEDCSPPPAQIPACAANAPGSSLGSNVNARTV